MKKKVSGLGATPKTAGNLQKPVSGKPAHKSPADHFGSGGEMQIGKKGKKGSATKRGMAG